MNNLEWRMLLRTLVIAGALSGCNGEDHSAKSGSAPLRVKSARINVGGNVSMVWLPPDAPVKWSVVEAPTHGRIDETGLYHAPVTPGVYTVIAFDTRTGTDVTAPVVVTDFVTAGGPCDMGVLAAPPNFPQSPGSYVDVYLDEAEQRFLQNGKAESYTFTDPGQDQEWGTFDDVIGLRRTVRNREV